MDITKERFTKLEIFYIHRSTIQSKSTRQFKFRVPLSFRSCVNKPEEAGNKLGSGGGGGGGRMLLCNLSKTHLIFN